MKKLIKLTSVAFFSATLFTSYAYAGEDQATYAVVDSNGVVANVIVCGPAVCGPNGSWGGKMPQDTGCPGCSLVLQVPVNPVTGQNQGSYIGTPENPVKYDSTKQVFTQGSASAPIPVVKTETVETTTISVTIQSEAVTFNSDSFVDGEMQFTPVVTENTGATMSATEGSTTQIQSFSSPQTREQVSEAVQNKSLLQRWQERLFVLLRGWILD